MQASARMPMWLDGAERLELPLSTSGARVQLLLVPLGRGSYGAGFYTELAGHGSRSSELGQQVFPGRYSAAVAALDAVRRHWHQRGAHELAAELDHMTDQW